MCLLWREKFSQVLNMGQNMKCQKNKIPKPATLDFDIFEKIPFQELIPTIDESQSEIDTIDEINSVCSDEEYNENYSSIAKPNTNIMFKSVEKKPQIIEIILQEEDYEPE